VFGFVIPKWIQLLKVARQEKTSWQCIIRLPGHLKKSFSFALTSA